jgi:hypothetical protein
MIGSRWPSRWRRAGVTLAGQNVKRSVLAGHRIEPDLSTLL